MYTTEPTLEDTRFEAEAEYCPESAYVSPEELAAEEEEILRNGAIWSASCTVVEELRAQGLNELADQVFAVFNQSEEIPF